MSKKIADIFTQIFHDMAVDELRMKNSNSITSTLTYNSVLYMDIIYAHPGKYTATAIAEMLQVSTPAVIQKVNALVKQGYIRKEQSKTDKRVYYLYINDENENEYKVYDEKERELESEFKKRYSQKEIDTFYEILTLAKKIYMGDIIK